MLSLLLLFETTGAAFAKRSSSSGSSSTPRVSTPSSTSTPSTPRVNSTPQPSLNTTSQPKANNTQQSKVDYPEQPRVTTSSPSKVNQTPSTPPTGNGAYRVTKATTAKPPIIQRNRSNSSYYQNGAFSNYLMTGLGTYLVLSAFTNNGDPIYVHAETGDPVDEQELTTMEVQAVDSVGGNPIVGYNQAEIDHSMNSMQELDHAKSSTVIWIAVIFVLIVLTLFFIYRILALR